MQLTTTVKIFILAITATCCAILAHAQVQVDPLAQINWPAVTGLGAPISYCPTTVTGNTVNLSTSVHVNSSAGIVVNQRVTGSGIPTGSVVTAFNAATYTATISHAATITATGVSLSFYSLGMPYTDTTNQVAYTCGFAGWSS